MSNYFECRGEAFELTQEGTLVKVLRSYEYFKADQVANVLKFATPISDLTEYFKRRHQSLMEQITLMEQSLHYADGRAYYQDISRIRSYRDQLRAVRAYLDNNQ